MPNALIDKMKSGYAGKGLSKQDVNHRVYGALNNMGAMHGSKETKKGARMEDKYVRDHGVKRSAKDAAAALEAHMSKRGR